MTLAASQADITYDWELWIGRTVDAVTTWTQIFGFESLPFPDKVPESVDVTHLQSPGRSRETIPGLLPVAEWSQEKQMWPGHAGDVLLDTLAALTEAGTPEDVLIEFNIPDAMRRTYRGHVKAYTPTGSVGEKAMANTAIDLFERQATNARVIA